jgi:hypothetical protein
MKRTLLFLGMVVAAAPVFAQSINPIAVAALEPSTVSLIAAGVVALGIARRKITKS